MQTINLRKFYLEIYDRNTMMEVADEVAEELENFYRQEDAYRNRVKYHKAFYSLDACDQIEIDVLCPVLSVEDFLEKEEEQRFEEERKEMMLENMEAAILKLPDIQARRIHAFYIQNKSITEIASYECVGKTRITKSIQHGLKNLKNIFEKFSILGGTFPNFSPE